jgi:CBS domain-containing protein
VLAPDNSLAQAIDLLLSTAQTAFPVLDRKSGRLVGLLSEDDLLKGLRHQPATVPLSSAMQTDVPTTTAVEPLFGALQYMASTGATAMVVLDVDGAVIGLLTANDINEAYRLLMISPTTVERTDVGTRAVEARPAHGS